MKFFPTPLIGAFVVEPEPLSDQRGWFMRTYCKNEFKAIGHEREWVQINHSFTALAGMLRGLHYQVPPYEEIKLVRCIAGAIFDTITDLRKGSASFLRTFSIELSAQNRKMLYIPAGFAHGFQALRDDTELIYHHSEFYTPGSEAGIRYDDPMLGIQWPLPVTMISDRDLRHPFLNESFKGY